MRVLITASFICLLSFAVGVMGDLTVTSARAEAQQAAASTIISLKLADKDSTPLKTEG